MALDLADQLVEVDTILQTIWKALNGESPMPPNFIEVIPQLFENIRIIYRDLIPLYDVSKKINDLVNQPRFRGEFGTLAELNALVPAAPDSLHVGDFAHVFEIVPPSTTSNVWTYTSDKVWKDSGKTIPNQIEPPYDGVMSPVGVTAGAGTLMEYARGDHVHILGSDVVDDTKVGFDTNHKLTVKDKAIENKNLADGIAVKGSQVDGAVDPGIVNAGKIVLRDSAGNLRSGTATLDTQVPNLLQVQELVATGGGDNAWSNEVDMTTAQYSSCQAYLESKGSSGFQRLMLAAYTGWTDLPSDFGTRTGVLYCQYNVSGTTGGRTMRITKSTGETWEGLGGVV
jgi:hypothetical protein